MQRLYLYLASRSKSGIKIVTVLQGPETVNADLESLEDLNLPPTWQHKIQQIIHDNRMLYHPRIESASNYQELKKSLEYRGFKNVPNGVAPILNMAGYIRAPIANTSSCKVQKTMLRKMKR